MATVDFTVVAAKLEAKAFARVNDVLYTQHPDSGTATAL